MLSRGRLAEYDLSALRYLTQAGGAMPPAVVKRVREALPAAQLIIMYGQTEATARISWLPPDRLDEKLGSAGVAIPGVTLRILKEDGTEASVGEAGEVCVKGPNVMLGYWNNPQATAAVLRDGWLHTGDMGHIDQDGYLFLVGRRSDMIKTGAHRVHPQDIEAVIMEMPGVAEVAVVGMEDEVLGEAIRAVIVAAENGAPDPLQVKAYCRARLANYKVPKVVEFRTSLPRTASGKIIRQTLAERKQVQ
jgi:acyl-CoA synthetase (AMP-forming)/AMP-acid ligase II